MAGKAPEGPQTQPLRELTFLRGGSSGWLLIEFRRDYASSRSRVSR
jgi:hypothetical protein